jgi:hypothetical protein
LRLLYSLESARDWTHKENNTMETHFASSAERINQPVKDKLNDLAQSAGERLERGRVGTAEALESAADAVRAKGVKAGAAITNLSSKAATNLDTSARYVRNVDLGQLWSDMGALARQHPGAIAVGAIAAGYCMGRMMTRRARCTQVHDA